MKISTYALSLLLAGASFSSVASNGNVIGKAPIRYVIPRGAEYLPDRVILKIKNQYRNNCTNNQVNISSVNKVLQALGSANINKKYPKHQPVSGRDKHGNAFVDISLIYEVKFNAPISVQTAVNELLATGVMEYAEPNYIHRTVFTPNDANIASQNAHLNPIKVKEAWDVTQGDTNVVIGIVDSGVKTDHPDLQGNLQKNYADPIDGIDNDNNGKIDDYLGWDFGGADYNSNPLAQDNSPTVTGGNNGHGTHVGGLAAAHTNNLMGVVGTGFKCRLLAIKCAADNDTRANGAGYILGGYDGIVYAADRGAKVINCSWGGAGSGGGYGQDIINYASINKGVAVVAAAGNDNSNAEFYPAYYDNVISVAATTNTDRKAGFSNYHYKVTVSAPGNNIYSTLWNNAYGTMSGTSMASPIVAGAVALLKSKYPNYSPAQLKALIRSTCDDIYSLSGNNIAALAGKLGKGRINLFRGVTELNPALRATQTTITDNDNNILPGDTLKLAGSFINLLNPSSANLKVTVSSTNTNITVLPTAGNTTASETFGVMATNATKSFSAPIRIYMKPSLPLNTVIDLKLTYTDGTYTDFEYISFTANSDYVNVEKNNITTSIGSYGRIGFMDNNASIGLGFQYKKENMMYEMSLITGISADSISNCARGAVSANPWDDDFVTISRAVAINPSIISAYDVNAVIQDDNSNTALGLEITQKSYAFTTANDSNYVMVVYHVKNVSGANRNNFHLGLYADWDVSTGGTNDRAKWSAAEKLGYVYDTDVEGYFAGVAALSTANPHYYAFKNDGTDGGFGVYDGYTDAEKFNTISGLNKDSSGMADVSMTVGSGPYSLASGETIEVAFALVGGENLNMIKAAAQAAQIKYNGLPTSIRNNKANTLAVKMFPNPAKDKVTVRIPEAKGLTNIELYDAVGRLMSNTSSDASFAEIKTAGYSTGVYTLKIRNGNALSIQKLVIE